MSIVEKKREPLEGVRWLGLIVFAFGTVAYTWGVESELGEAWWR